MTTTLRQGESGPLVNVEAALSNYGLQPSWAIDPSLGNDANAGTPAAPLRTMGEFNARISGNLLQVPATLKLVGNVLDQAMQLTALRVRLGAGLSVSGTRTSIGSGSISAVTPIGNGGTTYPFQLTTSGINWTLIPANAQILMQGGQLAWIRNVIDANNIVVGAMTLPTSSAFFTPTAGLTFTVSSLSRALRPMISGNQQTNGNINLTQPLVFQDLSFDGGAGCSIDGIGMLFAGCEVVSSNNDSLENQAAPPFLLRSCRFTLQSPTLNLVPSSGRLTIAGGCVVSPGSQEQLVAGSGNHLIQSLSFLNSSYFLGGGSSPTLQIGTGGMHFESVTIGPVFQIFGGGYGFCNGSSAIVNGRNNGGATFGFDLTFGQFFWVGAGNAPTLGIASGAASDIRLGQGGSALTFTYATLGSGKQVAALDAVPPTTTQIQLGGYASIGQIG